MMEDRLNSSLLNMGFQRLNSNAQGIYLFYRTAEDCTTIVSVVNAIKGSEITIEQYGHILEQIKSNFTKQYPYRIQLLSLVLTSFPDQVKHFSTLPGDDSHWIIDLSTNRLMMFETQLNDFSGLKGMIEQLLSQEQTQYYESAQSGNEPGEYPNTRNPRSSDIKTIPFTPVNTVIVVINIIAYLISHYTLLFGGEEQMFTKGALSWYYVIENKEYYRMLTSMFMHMDWSHLINNMVVLFFIGINLERAAGKLRYLFIYFGTGIVAGIASIGYNMWKENAVYELGASTFSIGASGAIFGVVGAIFYIVIANKGRLAAINTRQIAMFAVLTLYGGVINSQVDQAAHVGGFLAGLLLAAILYRPGQKAPGKTDHAEFV